ncbi:WxL domain-containing protein [Enterococcus faecalis]|nr:WxL domain-containing protein [Enterococcus faecalis]
MKKIFNMFLIFLLLLIHLPVYAVGEEIDNQKVDLEQVENSSEENPGELQTKESDNIKDRQEISEEVAEETAIVEESINEELSEKKKDVVGSGLSEDDSVSSSEQKSDIDVEKTVIDEDQSTLSRSGVVMDNDGQPVEYGKWYALGNFDRGLIGHDGQDSWLRYNSTNTFTRLFRFRRVDGSGEFVELGVRVKIEVDANTHSNPANKFVYSIVTDAGINTFGDLNTPQTNARTTNFGLYSDGAGGYYIQPSFSMGSTIRWLFYHGTGNGIHLSTNTTKSSFRIINTIRVTTNEANGGTATANGERITSAPISSIAQLQAKPNPGWSFSSWEIVGNSAYPGLITTPNSTSTQYVVGIPSDTLGLRANFVRNTYTLNSAVTPSNAGRVSPATAQVRYQHVQQIAATPNPGYRFVRWNVSGAGSSVANATSANTTFTMGHENATATAVFERASYTLNTTTMPLNGGNVQVGSTNVTFGDSTSISATPNPGYQFVRWGVSGAGSSVANATSANTTFTMGTANATLTAEFEAVHELNAKAVPQTLALGGRFLESQVGRFVENVTYNGEKLSEKEYKVTLASQPNSDVNGSTVQATVNVEHVSSKTTKKVEIPVTIGTGHSILFLGGGNLGAGYYTWHPELQRLTARRSSPNSPATTQVNGQFNEVYYSLSQYQLTQQQTVLAEKTPNYAYEVQGTQTINSAMENFGEGQQEIEAKAGDVFEIYHRESSSRLKYYLNFGDRMDLSTRDNRAYIELTKDGYEFLHFDRVETPKVSIVRGMTKGELDKEVDSYVNLSQAPNVEIVGFTNYPDTTKVGESKGAIRVQEKLTTGKYVQKDYEVTFTVEAGLEVKVVPQTLALGGRFLESQVGRFVENVTYNGEKLSEKEYKVTLASQPNSDVNGSTVQATVNIEHVSSKTTKKVEVPVTIGTGHSILFLGGGNLGAGYYTWHPELQRLTARRSSPNSPATTQVNGQFNEVYYSLSQYQLTQQQTVLAEKTPNYAYEVQGTQTINSAMENFGKGQQEIEAKVGDVFEIYHRESSSRLKYYLNFGDRMDLSTRDNRAYIELTKDGYEFLQFDRVETPKVSIIRGMTKGELDKEVGSYVKLSQAPNVEVVGFTTYPDTTKVGESKGTIRVQEKLTTGKYVQKDYEVVFIIEPNTLEFERVEDVNFDFGQVKQSSRKQTVNAQGKNAPKITLSDYTEGKSWQLLVSQPEGLKDGKGNKIKGATISLEDIRVIDTVHANVLTANRVELSQSEKVVAQMVNTTGKQEKGKTDIQIGESRDQQLSGVRLTIPRNTVVNEGNYSASIVWELVGDPTV